MSIGGRRFFSNAEGPLQSAVDASMGVSQIVGYPFGGPHNKDCRFLGFIFRSRYVRKLPYNYHHHFEVCSRYPESQAYKDIKNSSQAFTLITASLQHVCCEGSNARLETICLDVNPLSLLKPLLSLTPKSLSIPHPEGPCTQ